MKMCMRFAGFVCMSLATCMCFAQDRAAGTNVVIVSEIIEEPAWKRQVVMQDGEGDIFNDDGTVGSAAESAAAGEAAEHAAEISDAANVAMTNALRVLTDTSAN
ncbi:MAG: hypothetical protein II872_07225, partial [Clostridia bacterium]|nr:hypothetical protein [Clostridia bacterium]